MMEPRVKVIIISLCAASAWIALLSLALPDGFFTSFLLDRQTRLAPYPFTVQNMMWLVFFAGAGELFLRQRAGKREWRQIQRHLLPEDEKTVLRREDLGALYRQVRATDMTKTFLLQRLISRCVLQFQSSGSVNQTNSLFNASLELYQHEIELRYNMLRYLVWLIPTLGFIGTVVGIALALSDAGAAQHYQDPQLLRDLTQSLGVAFYTTLLALIMSALLVFVLHIVQGKEETALNQIGQYCLDNLINRLYEKQQNTPHYASCA